MRSGQQGTLMWSRDLRTANALGALFLVSMAMRFQLSALPPLLPRIEADLGMSHTWGGLLTSASFVMMGFGALATAAALRLLGPIRGVTLATGLTLLCGVARSAAPDALLVILVGIPLGLAVGLATGLMPLIVGGRFAGRVGLGTGTYAAGISVGSWLSFAIAAPIAQAVAGWRPTLLVFAAMGLILALPWVAIWGQAGASPKTGARLLPRLPSSGVAWLPIGIFALQTLLFFGLNTWLPTAYVERGWSETSAGLLGSGLIATSLLGSVAAARLRDAPGSTDRYLMAAASGAAVGCFGLVLFPVGAWAWTALAGAATGILFVLSLKLPLELGSDAHEVASLSALMLALGYWTGGIAPLVLGAIRDGTGAFTASFATLGALSLVLIVVSVAFTSRRHAIYLHEHGR